MSIIVIRRVRARIRMMMIGMVLATVVAALAANVLGGVIILGSAMIVAMIAHVPIIPIVSFGEITIASAIISVAARIMIARGALVSIAISTPVVPVFVPAAVQTVVFMAPFPAPVIAVAETIIPVAVADAIIAITKTLVAIAIGLIAS